jgi:NIMA (never in mitosis gene a)-related kinase
MVRGLKALHDLKICHRDIKCANIFMTKEGVVKLGDLNVSKVAKGGLLRTQTGTPYYACPEVWKDMPYDHRGDIWSVGCVLYEMITKQPPFRAQTMKGLYSKVLSGKYEPIANHYSQDLKSMLRTCLQVKPSDRPSCQKILRLPGLLNHVTGTLDELQALEPDENEALMKTIRMPRRMGEVTNRLPKPQYDKPAFKRNNS